MDHSLTLDPPGQRRGQLEAGAPPAAAKRSHEQVQLNEEAGSHQPGRKRLKSAHGSVKVEKDYQGPGFSNGRNSPELRNKLASARDRLAQLEANLAVAQDPTIRAAPDQIAGMKVGVNDMREEVARLSALLPKARSQVTKDTHNGPAPDPRLTISALIRSEMGGKLIGRQGCNIRFIRDQSGANVDVQQKINDCAERIVTIIGYAEQVAKALCLVVEKIGGSNWKTEDSKLNDLVSLTLLIETRNVGAIIGMKGATINKIRQQSEAKITISNDPLAASTQNSVVISGTRYQVQIAIGSIMEQLKHEEPTPRPLTNGNAQVRVPFDPTTSATTAAFRDPTNGKVGAHAMSTGTLDAFSVNPALASLQHLTPGLPPAANLTPGHFLQALGQIALAQSLQNAAAAQQAAPQNVIPPFAARAALVNQAIQNPQLLPMLKMLSAATGATSMPATAAATVQNQTFGATATTPKLENGTSNMALALPPSLGQHLQFVNNQHKVKIEADNQTRKSPTPPTSLPTTQMLLYPFSAPTQPNRLAHLGQLGVGVGMGNQVPAELLTATATQHRTPLQQQAAALSGLLERVQQVASAAAAAPTVATGTAAAATDPLSGLLAGLQQQRHALGAAAHPLAALNVLQHPIHTLQHLPGTAVAPNGLPPSETDEKSFPIPSSEVGKIIGRGGHRISEVRARSGAKIHISPADGDAERIITITGPPNSVKVAIALVLELLGQSNNVPIGHQAVLPTASAIPWIPQYQTPLPQ